MVILSEILKFPPVEKATSDGLLAIGGDLSTERLLLAYSKGIFPWYGDDEPILWWSPDPRFVLFPDKLKVSKSMHQVMKKDVFNFTVNKDFESVIYQCATVYRDGQPSTWITEDMILAYVELHKKRYTKSVEVWLGNELVGGLYGVDLENGVFSGESMFSKVSNASKAGFIWFVQNSNYKLIDCQVYTNHLESFGAELITRQKFLEYLF